MTKTQKTFWLIIYLIVATASSWFLGFGVIGWIVNYLLLSPLVIFIAIQMFHKEKESYRF